MKVRFWKGAIANIYIYIYIWSQPSTTPSLKEDERVSSLIIFSLLFNVNFFFIFKEKEAYILLVPVGKNLEVYILLMSKKK